MIFCGLISAAGTVAALPTPSWSSPLPHTMAQWLSTEIPATLSRRLGLGANFQTAVYRADPKSQMNALQKHPSTKDRQDLMGTSFPRPLDWDTFEVCCMLESSRVIQQDSTRVNDGDSLRDNTPCSDSFPSPVSFPQTPASWNHHGNKLFALKRSN